METTQSSGLGIAVTERKGEVAISAMAAKAKAEVEAKFVIALQRPRNIMDARASILAACKRPGFAETARYRKPVGGNQTIDGLSIRFAETAIQAMRNITVDTSTIWEDDEKRTVRISVTDLESNLSYGKDVTIAKTVERRRLKDGQDAVSKRTNSTGQTVYIVAATEDEIANKVSSQESKVIRNCGLRLIPQDILDEAEQTIISTLENGGTDPAQDVKKISDAFSVIGVRPSDLESYLGNSLASISKKQLTELRAIYAAVKDGEASFIDYIREKQAADGAKIISVQTTPAQTQQQPPADTSNPELMPVGKTDVPSVKTQLADLVTGAGHSFDDFRKWSAATGQFTEAEVDAIGSFEEVPQVKAQMFVKNKTGLLKGIAMTKGAA